MTFSIIIIVHNRLELLKYSLWNLNFMDFRDFEVIIIDDHSDHEIAAGLKELELGYSYRVIRHEVKKGISQARNTGIDNSTGDVLIFTDAGLLFPFDYLAKYQASYEKNGANCAIAGNTLYLKEYDLPRGNLHEKGVYAEFFLRITEKKFSVAACEVRKWYKIIPPGDRWKCFIGNNCSCWRRSIENGQRFETAFSGWGCDDSEFAYRLTKKGIDIILDFDIVNYHLYHPTSPRLEQVKSFLENNSIFRRLHPEITWSGILPARFLLKQLEAENQNMEEIKSLFQKASVPLI